MSGADTYTAYRQYIPQFPSCFNSPINQGWVKEKFNWILAEQQRKFIAKNLNPFNLCPISMTFWFPITQNTRVGVAASSIENIGIIIRQQIEPNELIHLAIKILQLHLPFPLALLAMFSSLGLFINGSVNKLIENATTQLINEQEERLNNLEDKIEFLSSDIVPAPSQLPPDMLEKVREALAEENNRHIRQALNPFNLCPIMSFYFPIFKTHTAIGVSFIDLQRLDISIKQYLEPQDVFYTLIRFVELRVPFPLTILVLFLASGLFFNGGINKFEQGTCNEIMNEVKRTFQQYRK